MSSELRRRFPRKERRVDELLDFVKIRTNAGPNYTLLFGAGTSATSGIRTAGEMASRWLKSIYENLCRNPLVPYSEEAARKYLSQHHSDWYSAQKEYTSLFGKKFDLPSQRRSFIEEEVDGKVPSLGHVYLMRLIEHWYFRTILTTNFDDTLNEAFHRHSSLRPIICAHDSSISSITVTSDRPKIIKLHGDYLFDDLKATIRETESLGNNIANKFAELCKNQGLIVVGYSGRDRSVMDVLQHLAKQDDYLPYGLYWCTRPDDVPSEELIDLLCQERVYWVEIEGFDELMAMLHRHCVGNELPIKAAAASKKSRELIAHFCNNAALQRSTNPILQEDLARIRKEDEHSQFVESTQAIIMAEANAYCDAESLSYSEQIKIMTLQRYLRERKIDEVLQRTATLLSESSSNAFRERLLRIRIHAERSLGRLNDALHTCDELVDKNPGDVAHLLLRADVEPVLDNRLAILSRAIEIKPSCYSAFGKRAELLNRQLNEDPHCDVTATARRILHDYQEAIELHPCSANPFWSPYFHFLLAPKIPLENQRELLNEVLRRLQRMNAGSTTYLELRVEYARHMEGLEGARQAIAEIRRAAMQIQPRGNSRSIRMLLLRSLRALGRMNELFEEVVICDLDETLRTYGDYIIFRAEVLAHTEGKLSAAIDLLQANERSSYDAPTANRLITYLGHVGRVEEAKAVLQKCRESLDTDDRHDLEGHICSLLGDYAGALEHTRQRRRRTLFPGQLLVSETHDLLKLKRFAEAESVSRHAIDAPHLEHFHALMINHELARIRQGHQASSTRLERILATSEANLTRVCAHLLTGDTDSATHRLLKAIHADRTTVYAIRNWAIFDIPEFSNWLASTLHDHGHAQPSCT